MGGECRPCKGGSDDPDKRRQELALPVLQAAQLRVRSRLVRIVAAAIRHMGDWKRLPKGGRESWYALFPDGDLQRVQEGINEENVAGDGAGGFTPGSSEPACA